ncbi:MAG: hypothetical protein ACFFCD_12810 [Promethearchaeota archaeon]
MKLRRLKSIANNAVRDSILTPESIMIEPFSIMRPKETIEVDLINGDLTPDRKGDDVEKFYKNIFKWFHQALKKEGIPLNIIESAKVIISTSGKKCIIIACGKTFKSESAF